jgi:arylsulfatase
MTRSFRSLLTFAGLAAAKIPAIVFGAPAQVQALAEKPEHARHRGCMGDDIGCWNISAYNRSMTGYHTPDIDCTAAEGTIFIDYYGQQSCTAGRSAFITR